MQQAHDTDGVVGRELAKDAVAVRQALGENLEDGEGQVDDGVVVRLGRRLELGRGQAGREDVVAQEVWVSFCLGRVRGDVLADVKALCMCILSALRSQTSFANFSDLFQIRQCIILQCLGSYYLVAPVLQQWVPQRPLLLGGQGE